jgi:hypothetical protein
MYIRYFIIFQLAFAMMFSSCENVEDGYRVDYNETPAEFNVELVSADRGAVGDNVTFSISASSDFNIKSVIVTSSVSGGGNSGFEVKEGEEDPLIDHAYGTIQPETKSLDLLYHFEIANDSVDARITFQLIDEFGKKDTLHVISGIPSIVSYDSIILVTNTRSQADGFSTNDGEIYQDANQYSDVTATNIAIQSSIDFVYVVNGSSALLASPYNGAFSSSFQQKNKTLFMKMPAMTDEEFKAIDGVVLSLLTEENNVEDGTTYIGEVKVGDVVGFRTDFASSNPYHFGMLKINAIHPTQVDYYEGVSYLIELDIITQK